MSDSVAGNVKSLTAAHPAAVGSVSRMHPNVLPKVRVEAKWLLAKRTMVFDGDQRLK